jgi:SAM-dependent methyltransferase
VDLTAESVARVRTRLSLRALPYETLTQASVLNLPFAADSFDVVFSHGVLHHVPQIEAAQGEIHRVLRPGGELVIMVYARWSLDYLVSIGLIRRAALLAAYPLARAEGLRPAAARLSERRLGSWVGRRVRTGVAACQPAAH